MSVPVANPVQASADTARLWQDIGANVREACILRRQGRHQAAATILERELPAQIRAWAAECGLATDEAKARLNQLFRDEQARVESHWLMVRLVADSPSVDSAVRQLSAFPAAPAAERLPELPARLAPRSTPSSMVFPAIAPRRIPIEDVVDMIDAVRDRDAVEAHTVPSPFPNR